MARIIGRGGAELVGGVPGRLLVIGGFSGKVTAMPLLPFERALMSD
jgi:hypothetical protein